jgi:hypothetical protein
MLEYIYSQPSAADILRELQSLPADINDLYHRIFKKINAQSPAMRELARRALMWTVHAAELINAFELKALLGIEERTKTLEEAAQKYKTQTIVDACFNLLGVDKGGYMRLMHQTTQEFLNAHTYYVKKRSDERSGERLKIYDVNPPSPHVEMSRSCIRCLDLDYPGCVYNGLIPDMMAVLYAEEYPGCVYNLHLPPTMRLNYADVYWHYHMEKIIDEHEDIPPDILKLVKKLMDEYPYLIWSAIRRDRHSVVKVLLENGIGLMPKD